MMNADQNVDRHVVDQNVNRISGEIAYVLLGERIRSKCSSCMQPFFLLKKWVQDLLTKGQEKMGILVMLSRGPHMWNMLRTYVI